MLFVYVCQYYGYTSSLQYLININTHCESIINDIIITVICLNLLKKERKLIPIVLNKYSLFYKEKIKHIYLVTHLLYIINDLTYVCIIE